MADITFSQTAAADVPTPASGKTAFFFTTADGTPHYKDSSGTDHALGGNAGTVTSVALAMPSIFTVTGSPVTDSGTLTASLANANANTALMGPSSGAAAAPTMRTLVAADLPVMGASGSSHAAGAVPDPGATAGTTKFLREDGTWDVPAGGGGDSPTGTAGGDLSGTYPNPAVAKLQGYAVSSVAPTDGQVLQWSNVDSQYEPVTPSGGGGGSGTVTSIATTAPITGGTIATTGTIAHATSGVTAGSYTNLNATIDEYGHVTAASNGSGGGGGGDTTGNLDDSSGTVDWDVSAIQVATLTLTQGSTLNNPTNMANGKTYLLFVKQDSTGNYSLSFGTAYQWPGGVAPIVSTSPNAVDIISFICDGTSMYGVWQGPFSAPS